MYNNHIGNKYAALKSLQFFIALCSKSQDKHIAATLLSYLSKCCNELLCLFFLSSFNYHLIGVGSTYRDHVVQKLFLMWQCLKQKAEQWNQQLWLQYPLPLTRVLGFVKSCYESQIRKPDYVNLLCSKFTQVTTNLSIIGLGLGKCTHLFIEYLPLWPHKWNESY